MRKLTGILLLIGIWGTSVSQTYLDTIYDFGDNERGKEVGCLNCMKFNPNGSIRTAYGSGSVSDLSYNLVYFDFGLSGEISNVVRFGDSTERYWPVARLDIASDTTVQLSRYSSGNDTVVQNWRYALTSLNNQTGEMFWQNVYGSPSNSNTPFGLTRSTDGGYVMTGSSYDFLIEDGNLYTVKTDIEGNQIWDGNVGGNEHDVGYGVFELNDGGYLIGGRTKSFGNGNYDVYVVKLDSQGSEIWHETVGSNLWDGAFGMIGTADGNFLLYGAKNNKMGLVKIDESTTIDWEFDYGQSNRSPQLYGALELAAGGFVCLGLSDNPNDNSNEGCAIKVNSNGQLLWERYYNRNIGTDFFTDGLIANEEGYVFSGQALNTSDGTADAWILKVDSVGCPYPNCLTGVSEHDRIVLLDVWPNPVSDLLNLELSPIVSNLDVQIHDMNGRLQSRIVISDTRTELDVSSWAKGIYIITGVDGQQRSFSLKFVKE